MPQRRKIPSVMAGIQFVILSKPVCTMIAAAWLLTLQLLALRVFAMPYQVPLQGLVGGKRTLVVLEDASKASEFSKFFDSLSSRGHELSFHGSDSSELSLKKFGEFLYDNIVLFSPSADKLGSLSFDEVVDFSNEGGNVLVALSRDASEAVRDFVDVLGYKVHKKGSAIIDHFQFHDSSAEHTHVLSSNAIESNAVLGKYNSKKPVLYHGVGLDIDSDNILAVKVLQGNPTTYSATPNKPLTSSKLQAAGGSTLLVGALQARNNARVVVSGSLDMFSNDFMTADNGNQLFCTELSKWTFGESGVLRFRDIVHHKSDGTPPDVILHEKHRPDHSPSLYPDPEITRNSLVYRIKDDIRYSMVVEEYREGAWHTFKADDMQMEFVMLDPYVRKTMKHEGGRFVADFTAPDSYGVFKFRVLYRRTGYSVLHAETQVSIRPFKHNEYDRFIFSAYPYYISALSATVAFFVFSVLFGFSKTN